MDREQFLATQQQTTQILTENVVLCVLRGLLGMLLSRRAARQQAQAWIVFFGASSVPTSSATELIRLSAR